MSEYLVPHFVGSIPLARRYFAMSGVVGPQPADCRMARLENGLVGYLQSYLNDEHPTWRPTQTSAAAMAAMGWYFSEKSHGQIQERS